MAVGAVDRETRYCYRLAPSRFPLVLDMRVRHGHPVSRMRQKKRATAVSFNSHLLLPAFVRRKVHQCPDEFHGPVQM